MASPGNKSQSDEVERVVAAKGKKRDREEQRQQAESKREENEEKKPRRSTRKRRELVALTARTQMVEAKVPRKRSKKRKPAKRIDIARVAVLHFVAVQYEAGLLHLDHNVVRCILDLLSTADVLSCLATCRFLHADARHILCSRANALFGVPDQGQWSHICFLGEQST